MRVAQVERSTSETQIRVKITLDGQGLHKIESGVGFLDHMLRQVALHGLFDLELEAKGDVEVDCHHTVEDCALALGQALDQALGERAGLVRMGSCYAPMDDALALVIVDLSGRPYCLMQAEWRTASLGLLPTSLVNHFFQSLATAGRFNLHGQLLYAQDDHHGAEALFKALGRALLEATRIDPRRAGRVPSTKGSLV